MTPQEITIRDVLDVELRAVRDSIDALTRQVQESDKRSTAEHAEVRGELRALQRQLDTAVPSTEQFDRFKQFYHERHEALQARIDRVEDDADQRDAIARWKRWAFGALTGAGGLAVSVIALVLSNT